MAKCLQNRTLIQTYNSNKKSLKLQRKTKLLTLMNQNTHSSLRLIGHKHQWFTYIYYGFVYNFPYVFLRQGFFNTKNIKTDQTWKNELPLFTYSSRTWYFILRNALKRSMLDYCHTIYYKDIKHAYLDDNWSLSIRIYTLCHTLL